MSLLTAVLPFNYRPWYRTCITSMCPALLDATLLVDNTERNIGVAASWNRGVERMQQDDSEWLVLLSQSLVFLEPGGADFIAALQGAPPDALAIEGHHGIGWHLIAFSRRVIEGVGRFDENFPAYDEDLDYARRVNLTYGPLPGMWWQKASTEVAMRGFAGGIDMGGARPSHARNRAYYAAKWGGYKGDETYPVPFADPSRDLTWWPEPPDPRSVIGR